MSAEMRAERGPDPLHVADAGMKCAASDEKECTNDGASL